MQRCRSQRRTICSFQVPVRAMVALHLPPLVACVPDDALNEWKAPPSVLEQCRRAISVLYARRMNADRQQQPEGVRQDVALAAKHLLASIEARCIERSPPLTAPLALWLSMIAVVGLASRPAFSRTST